MLLGLILLPIYSFIHLHIPDAPITYFTFALSRSYKSVVLLCAFFIFSFVLFVSTRNSWDYTNVNRIVFTPSNLITYLVVIFFLIEKYTVEEEQELALVADKLKMLATNTVCGDILAFSLIMPHPPPTIACGTKVSPLSLLNFNHLQTHIYCVLYCASSSVKLCTLISCSTYIFGTYNSNIIAFSILGLSISS